MTTQKRVEVSIYVKKMSDAGRGLNEWSEIRLMRRKCEEKSYATVAAGDDDEGRGKGKENGEIRKTQDTGPIVEPGIKVNP